MEKELKKSRDKVLKNAAFKMIQDKFNGRKEMRHYLRGARALNKHLIQSIPWLEIIISDFTTWRIWLGYKIERIFFSSPCNFLYSL